MSTHLIVIVAEIQSKLLLVWSFVPDDFVEMYLSSGNNAYLALGTAKSLGKHFLDSLLALVKLK